MQEQQQQKKEQQNQGRQILSPLLIAACNLMTAKGQKQHCPATWRAENEYWSQAVSGHCFLDLNFTQVLEKERSQLNKPGCLLNRTPKKVK